MTESFDRNVLTGFPFETTFWKIGWGLGLGWGWLAGLAGLGWGLGWAGAKVGLGWAGGLALGWLGWAGAGAGGCGLGLGLERGCAGGVGCGRWGWDWDGGGAGEGFCDWHLIFCRWVLRLGPDLNLVLVIRTWFWVALKLTFREFNASNDKQFLFISFLRV